MKLSIVAPGRLLTFTQFLGETSRPFINLIIESPIKLLLSSPLSYLSTVVFQVYYHLCLYVLLFYRSFYKSLAVKKGVLRNFAKFTGKHLCQSFFF